MSGVRSIASHSTLQYFSEVVGQEHIGCAHFFVVSISILLVQRVTLIIVHLEFREHCPKQNSAGNRERVR